MELHPVEPAPEDELLDPGKLFIDKYPDAIDKRRQTIDNMGRL